MESSHFLLWTFKKFEISGCYVANLDTLLVLRTACRYLHGTVNWKRYEFAWLTRIIEFSLIMPPSSFYIEMYINFLMIWLFFHENQFLPLKSHLSQTWLNMIFYIVAKNYSVFSFQNWESNVLCSFSYRSLALKVCFMNWFSYYIPILNLRP